VPNFDVDCNYYEEFPITDPISQPSQKEEPPKNEHKTPVNTVPPPNLNIHAKFSVKVLKTHAITPIPNYKSMLDEELNVSDFMGYPEWREFSKET
jgi:hypothetical protein